MPGRKIVVPAEVESNERHSGIRAQYLGVPIYKVRNYVPPPGIDDGFHDVRKWYRSNIGAMGGLYVLHKSELQKQLANVRAGALEYLTTEDEAKRALHPDWLEPDNEALEISEWIFPAHAIDNAILAQDFDYQIIIVSVTKNEKEFDRVYYFTDPHEHMIKYSHHFRGRRPVSKV